MSFVGSSDRKSREGEGREREKAILTGERKRTYIGRDGHCMHTEWTVWINNGFCHGMGTKGDTHVY